MLRWVKAGVLPSYQTGGGRWRIRPEHLVEFMRERGMAIPEELAPQGPTVVIVDDDEGFVNALRRVVSGRRPDVRVLTAMDGFAGGMLVAAERPDLLLLDVHMEGLNGVEVCRRIRADDSLASIKIVILSGHLNEEREAELRGLGVLNCFRKPVPPAQIHALLDEHLPAPAQPLLPTAHGA